MKEIRAVQEHLEHRADRELPAPAEQTYRKGPDGPYSDERFLMLLEKTFYSKRHLPSDGLMRLTAAEVAYVELAVRF